MIPEHVAACLVDLDGTLYRPWPIKLAMAAELTLFGAGAIGVLRRFRAEHDLDTAELGGDNPYERQIDRTARAAGMPVERVRRIVEHWMLQRPAKWIGLFRRRSLIRELDAFQRQGGRLGLVSDYPARQKLASIELRFDAIVASGEPGGPLRLKPDPEGYLLAATRLEVAPECCLVIGDREDRDGVAARRAGMAFRLVH